MNSEEINKLNERNHNQDYILAFMNELASEGFNVTNFAKFDEMVRNSTSFENFKRIINTRISRMKELEGILKSKENISEPFKNKLNSGLDIVLELVNKDTSYNELTEVGASGKSPFTEMVEAIKNKFKVIDNAKKVASISESLRKTNEAISALENNLAFPTREAKQKEYLRLVSVRANNNAALESAKKVAGNNSSSLDINDIINELRALNRTTNDLKLNDDTKKALIDAYRVINDDVIKYRNEVINVQKVEREYNTICSDLETKTFLEKAEVKENTKEEVKETKEEKTPEVTPEVPTNEQPVMEEPAMEETAEAEEPELSEEPEEVVEEEPKRDKRNPKNLVKNVKVGKPKFKGKAVGSVALKAIGLIGLAALASATTMGVAMFAITAYGAIAGIRKLIQVSKNKHKEGNANEEDDLAGLEEVVPELENTSATLNEQDLSEEDQKELQDVDAIIAEVKAEQAAEQKLDEIASSNMSDEELDAAIDKILAENTDAKEEQKGL